MRETNDGEYAQNSHMHTFADVILAAIKAGKVPKLYFALSSDDSVCGHAVPADAVYRGNSVGYTHQKYLNCKDTILELHRILAASGESVVDAANRTVQDRDTLRAEVARLKARKVKLPPSFGMGNDTPRGLLEPDVRKALRSAGIAIEGEEKP